MSIRKHVHKLRRKTYRNKEQVYFCVLDCDYKISTSLALGKEVLCNRCGHKFNMSEYSCRLAKPHCSDCKVVTATVLLDEEAPVTREILDKLIERVDEDKDKPQLPSIQTNLKTNDPITEDLKNRLLKSIGSSLGSNKDTNPEDFL